MLNPQKIINKANRLTNILQANEPTQQTNNCKTRFVLKQIFEPSNEYLTYKKKMYLNKDLITQTPSLLIKIKQMILQEIINLINK